MFRLSLQEAKSSRFCLYTLNDILQTINRCNQYTFFLCTQEKNEITFNSSFTGEKKE